MVPIWKSESEPSVRSNHRRTIKGDLGALDKVFQDLKLSFDAQEFKSILYAVMSSDKYKLETVFFFYLVVREICLKIKNSMKFFMGTYGNFCLKFVKI